MYCLYIITFKVLYVENNNYSGRQRGNNRPVPKSLSFVWVNARRFRRFFYPRRDASRPLPRSQSIARNRRAFSNVGGFPRAGHRYRQGPCAAGSATYRPALGCISGPNEIYPAPYSLRPAVLPSCRRNVV